MPRFLDALILGLAIAGALDLWAYYLSGAPGPLSSQLGATFKVDGARVFAWWAGAALSLGLPCMPAARAAIRRVLERIPRIDAVSSLWTRAAARWTFRGLTLALPSVAILEWVHGLSLRELHVFPHNALLLTGWWVVLADRVLACWPEPATTLNVKEPVWIDTTVTGRFIAQPGVELVELPTGGGMRRYIPACPDTPVFKTERVVWLAFLRGVCLDAVEIAAIQIDSLMVHASRCWVYAGGPPSTQQLLEINPEILRDLEATRGGWADRAGPELLKQRCRSDTRFQDAATLLFLRRALGGCLMQKSQAKRVALDASLRGLLERVLSRLRDWQFSTAAEGTGGLALLSLRVHGVESPPDPEPLQLGELERLPPESFALIPLEDLQDALLGKREERLLDRAAAIAHRIAAGIAPETQRDRSFSALSPLEIDADRDALPAVLLSDWCGSSAKPEEGLARLLLSRSETLLDASGDRIHAEQAFVRWQEQRGLHGSPAHAAKLRGFLAECGGRYHVISSSGGPAELPLAHLAEHGERSQVPISK